MAKQRKGSKTETGQQAATVAAGQHEEMISPQNSHRAMTPIGLPFR
jgi:hypothetical protein